MLITTFANSENARIHHLPPHPNSQTQLKCSRDINFNEKDDLDPKMNQKLDPVPQSEVNEVQEKSEVQSEVQIEVQI